MCLGTKSLAYWMGRQFSFIKADGCRKSHLAAALSMRALEEGYIAYLIALSSLMDTLKYAEANNKLEKRIRAYLKPKK